MKRWGKGMAQGKIGTRLKVGYAPLYLRLSGADSAGIDAAVAQMVKVTPPQ